MAIADRARHNVLMQFVLVTLVVATVVAVGPAALSAQADPAGTEPDIAADDDLRPELGDGHAQITTYSRVELHIRSGPGTSGQRLSQMASAVTSRIGPIRTCYNQLSRRRPTLAGEIVVAVRVTESGRRPLLEKREDTVGHGPLLNCVQQALLAMPLGEVSRPAQVTVELTFGNTNAQLVGTVERPTANVEEEDGQLVARGETGNGAVRFDVLAPLSEAERDTTSARVSAVHDTVKRGIAGLLDCRRRASRNAMNSAGVIALRVAVPRHGAPQIRVLSSTVEDERAGHCVSRVLRAGRYAEGARGASQLRVHFTAADEAGDAS